MTIIFGSFTTKFANFSTGKSSPSEFKNDINRFVLWFIYLFVARFILSYVSTLSINISGIRTTRSIKRAFFENILRQEIWYFDLHDHGAAAIQVTTTSDRINHGIGEKLAIVIQSLSTFFSAFIIALTIQWKLALITISVIPLIIVIVGGGVNIDLRFESRIVQLYSIAAVLAQESIASISITQSFWAQNKMTQNYNEYLKKAYIEGMKRSPIIGVVFCAQYFVVNGAIALSFWHGFHMYQNGEIESVGTVFT
jgi:ATP-binding cassette subfamily B (MDR/TAP) protein 1